MFIPGIVLAEFLFPAALPDELPVIGFGIMILLAGACAFLYVLPTGFYAPDVLTAVAAVLVVLSEIRLHKPNVRSKIMAADKTGIYFMLLSFVFTACVIMLPVRGQIPFLVSTPWHTRLPFMDGDMVLQYRAAQFLMNKLDFISTRFYCCGWHVYDRPPLMAMTGAFLLGVFHINVSPAFEVWLMADQQVQLSGYPEFWVTGMLLDASVVLSGYLLLKNVFGSKVARMSAVFMVLNPFIFANNFFTSAKSMAAFFILFFYYCLLNRRHMPLASAFAGLGILSHPYALLFVIGGLTFYGLASRKSALAERLKTMMTMVAVIGMTVSVWLFWSYYIFGSLPLGLLTGNGVGILGGGPPTTPLDILWNRVAIAFRTVTPYFLGLTGSGLASIIPTFGQPWTSSIVLQAKSYPVLAALALVYDWTLPGALTLSLTWFCYSGYCKLFRSMKPLSVGFVAVPALLATAIAPLNANVPGLTLLFFQPIVPILLGIGAWRLSQARKSVWILVGLGMLLESILFTWGIVYPINLIFSDWSVADYALFGLALVCYSVSISCVICLLGQGAVTSDAVENHIS